MLDRIKALPLEEKKTLLAMLMADLKAYNAFVASVEPKKPEFFGQYYWVLETRKCAEIARIKRNGGQIITEHPELLASE